MKEGNTLEITASIFTTFCYYPSHISFVFSKHLSWSRFFSWWSDSNFQWSGPLVVPPGLGCCSFALTAITRCALRDLLYPKRSLPCLHGGAGVHFLLESQDSSPASLVAPFFACWFRGMKSPKGLDSSLNFGDNGIVVLFPCVSIPPFGRMTPRPGEQKVVRTTSKIFASGKLGVIISGAPSPAFPLIPGPMNSVDTSSEHTQPSRGSFPHPTRYCQLMSAINFTFSVGEDGEKHGKTSEFHEHGSTAMYLFEFQDQKQCRMAYHHEA